MSSTILLSSREVTAPPLPVLTGNPRADAAAFCRAMFLARLQWRLGAAGPGAFDCWSALVLTEAHLFGRDVELVRLRPGASRADIMRAFGGAATEAAFAQWRERGAGERPQHGDGVLMTHRAQPHHCGVWLDLDGGAAAHMAEHAGFCVDDMQALRLGGYTNLRFFEWAESL